MVDRLRKISADAERLMASPQIQRALKIPVPPAWSDDWAFSQAEQPAFIGRVLVAQNHKHLASAKIVYLFRKEIKGRDRIIQAKASLITGKLHFFTNFNFCVDVNWTRWRELSDVQRVALIDHELSHFGTEETDSGGRYVILSHDVEEFTSIVARWGLWQNDIRAMARVIKRQPDLFEVEG